MQHHDRRGQAHQKKSAPSGGQGRASRHPGDKNLPHDRGDQIGPKSSALPGGQGRPPLPRRDKNHANTRGEHSSPEISPVRWERPGVGCLVVVLRSSSPTYINPSNFPEPQRPIPQGTLALVVEESHPDRRPRSLRIVAENGVCGWVWEDSVDAV